MNSPNHKLFSFNEFFYWTQEYTKQWKNNVKAEGGRLTFLTILFDVINSLTELEFKTFFTKNLFAY